MKRSTILTCIATEISSEFIHDIPYISREKAEELASYVLSRIESEGMLPPLNENGSYHGLDNEDLRLEKLFLTFHKWED